MRAAVISDIHANLAALEAVLDDLAERTPDVIWCLGDTVGYGAEPNECVALVRERCDVCLAGNHDLGVLGTIPIDAFSPPAAAAARWTRERLDPQARAFLEGLAAADEEREAALYHASPRDHVWEYVLSTDQAAACLAVQARRVSLIGHSHIALAFRGEEDGGRIGGARVPADTTVDVSSDRWLLNPGSVGQPRDGDPRAAWLELDTERWRATYHRVEYDVERAANAIARAGLPEALGERLFLGQ